MQQPWHFAFELLPETFWNTATMSLATGCIVVQISAMGLYTVVLAVITDVGTSPLVS
jgi:hypothetical protein